MLYSNDLTKGIPIIRIIDPRTKHIKNKTEQDLIINDFHILPTAGHAEKL